MGGIEGALKEAGRQRGYFTEEKVLQAFQTVIDQRMSPGWLVDIEKTDPKDDRRGYDFWAVTADVGKIGFQVKSSKKGLEEAKRKHPKIPVVCLAPEASLEDIYGKCLQTISKQRDTYLKERRINEPFGRGSGI